MKRNEIVGGAPQVLCDVAEFEGAGGAWNRDGMILFAGATDDEISAAGFTEDLSHITCGSQAGERMVRRYGLNGQRSRTVLLLVSFSPLDVIR